MEGVTVHLPPGLILNRHSLLIKLGGFWKLRWLKVDGVALQAAACAY